MLRFSIIIAFLVAHSSSADFDCTTRTITFSPKITQITISRSRNSLEQQLCNITFIVSQFYVPQINVTSLNLTPPNQITFTQQSKYGGVETLDVSNKATWCLGPVNFTMSLQIATAFPSDNFNLTIFVSEEYFDSPSTFNVEPDLGEIIDIHEFWPLRTFEQLQNTSDDPTVFLIKVVLTFNYTLDDYMKDYLSRILVFDNQVYQGSAWNLFKIVNATGTSFSMWSMNKGFGYWCAFLISSQYTWSNSIISIGAAQKTDDAEIHVYNATASSIVQYEIMDMPSSNHNSLRYQNLQFIGNGTLTVYAGCVTGAQEARRVATITSANAAQYEGLRLSGPCRTLVLDRGIFQWNQSLVTHRFEPSLIPIDGQAGVIMSYHYPYESFLGFGPLVVLQPKNKSNIVVEYDVVYLDEAVTVNLTMTEGSNQFEHSFSNIDKNYTSIPSDSQQIMPSYASKGRGYLIRYVARTVAKKGSDTYRVAHLFIFIALCKLAQ